MIATGARVSALYQGDMKYYDAIVRSVLPDGMCTVTFIGYETDDPQKTSVASIRPHKVIRSTVDPGRFAEWEDRMQCAQDQWERKGAKASRGRNDWD